jgi:mannose-1-phosphate guanylyltransferase
MPDTIPVTPVILSGGSGTRLWPLSRADRPKQFLDFTGEGTMLELTLARTPATKGFGSPVVVCNANHIELVATHCDGHDATIILEPAARNTAPAIALAALELPADTLMLVSPSDHMITDVDAFHRAIEAAAPLARDGWLVTFGIKPTGPDTGYGYIRRGEAIGSNACRVERFVEKPDAQTAQGYIDDGCYNWNAGIFLFRAGDYMTALERFAPDMLSAANDALARANRRGRFIRPDSEAFAASPSDSIDYAVMEKAEKVAVVPVDMGWSDIGSWDALYDLLDKDELGNVQIGDVVNLGGSGCLVRANGPVVTLAGVSDLIVIATPDAVMILPRNASQDTKKIVEALKSQKHPTLER